MGENRKKKKDFGNRTGQERLVCVGVSGALDKRAMVYDQGMRLCKDSEGLSCGGHLQEIPRQFEPSDLQSYWPAPEQRTEKSRITNPVSQRPHMIIAP